MATVSLSATSRTEIGKGAARKIRALGQIPAIIYRAGQPATSVTIDPHALETAFRRSGNRNTLVDVSVDGNSFTCLVKKTQREPGSDVLLHVDFYEVDAGETVTVMVPVTSTGKSEGEEEGGKLRIICRDLMVRCKPGDIPAAVEVDVSPLSIGDFVRVSGITAPSGTEIIAPNDFNVITVIGKRLDLEEEEAAAEAVDAEGAEDSTETDGA